MNYVTVDSKLFIEGNEIRQKRVTKDLSQKILVSAFFFLWFIDLFIKKLNTALDTGHAGKWVLVSFYGILLLLFAGIIYDFIFRRYWKNKVAVSNIKKIKIVPSDNGLETDVVVTVKSNRYKLYRFRTLENQYDDFIDKIRSINPSIQLIIE